MSTPQPPRAREGGDGAPSLEARTPMFRQYREIKTQYPDAILFFRLGDFYEMFFEDAELAARILEITLTSRDKHKEDRVPMCGVPVHAAETYMTRLVQAGYRLAICEQVEDPRGARGLVRREVVRVLSPGLLTAEGGLSAKANNFLVALRASEGREPWGISRLDLSTGEFRVTELAGPEEALSELFRIEPSELLLSEDLREGEMVARLKQALPSAFFSYRPGPWFSPDRAAERLQGHFGTLTLEGFGIGEFRSGIGAASALLAYVVETQKGEVSHIRSLTPYHLSSCLVIDEPSKRNLEIVANCLDRTRHGTLLDVLDFTVTPMGGRLLKNWVLYPLRDRGVIETRLDAVEELAHAPAVLDELRRGLRQVYDLERLTGRIVLGTAGGRDLLALKQSLARIPAIRRAFETIRGQAGLLTGLHDSMDPMEDVTGLLERAIREDCPSHLREGHIIREGFSAELDELILIQRDGRAFVAGVEARERERTGISSLKVGYNKVFGYYIEVSKVRGAKVPEDYIRKQTLVAAERYITPELKEVEAKILTAQERRLALEYELFQEVRRRVASEGGRIQATARAVAQLDCLSALAEAALRHHYVRPVLDNGEKIEILEGRHPVVEQTTEAGCFVANDVVLDHEGSQVLIITGPNMAGKSTVLRQVALICLMAQMGSFVPAASAHIGLVDRIFTRVGATDYLARGQSTFMVEMSETANILHNATSRSLVILDEIGRGTSTYDGLAIAWAVAEHLLEKGGAGVKTLFATHYHELTELAIGHKKARNMHIAVKEWEGRIVFLRRLLDGATNRSYGIQVASLAGVPDGVIRRAKEILANIERGELNLWGEPRIARSAEPSARRRAAQLVLPLFSDRDDDVCRRLLATDINKLTPLEALNELAQLQALAGRPR